jgi:transposase
VIALRSDLKVVVASHPVDFRKGITGLVALVNQSLHRDPYAGDVFIFRSKRKDRLKMIVWDGTGMILVTKWLEDGRFTWPPISDGAIVLTPAQMAMLIDGMDWMTVRVPVVKRPVKVG